MKEERKCRAEAIQAEAAAKLKVEKKRNLIQLWIRIGALAALVVLVIIAANHGQSELPGPIVSTESIAGPAEKSPADEKEQTDGSKTENKNPES